MRGRTRLSLWGPVVLYLTAITVVSHQPSLRIPGGLPDWLMHGLEYAGLGALVARIVLRASAGETPVWLTALAGCAAFGVLDEFHQSFVPGRDASLHDVVADTAGAALALAIARLVASSREHGAAEIEITIYGRDDCHLCDEAEEVVRNVARGQPVRIRKIDIEQSPELRRLYREQVPVVMVNGQRMFKFRVDAERLRRKLESLRQRSVS